MYPGGYIAEVTNLSSKATAKDLYDFFAHCGAIEHVEIMRSSEYACTAYVTFEDAYALETAVLVSGAKIVDQPVCISHWGTYIDEADLWNSSSTVTRTSHFISTPGEAVTMAQEVVKTMIAKGYDLGKDALIKAKAFDESLQVSTTAAAKLSELGHKFGLTDTIYAGMETYKSLDEKFHVSDITKSATTATGTAAVIAATVAGKTAVAAANVVVNSSYFAKGAHWVSDMLSRAAKAAADMGNHDGK